MEANFNLLFGFALLLVGQMAQSQIPFLPYQVFETGSSADVVCIGDLNNDGRNDVAVGTGFYFDDENDYKVFVYLQDANGNLETPVKYSYTNAPPGLLSLKIADLNNDSRNDIAISYGNKVGVFYQNTEGIFNPIIEFEIGANMYARCLNTGDLNNDGLQDVVVSTSNSSSYKVFYQQLNGTLTMQSYPKPTDVQYDEVEIGDVNGDGKDDAVFMIKTGTTRGFDVCLQGENTLLEQINYTAPPTINGSTISISGIAVGDLNNDSNADVALSHSRNSPNARILVWHQDPVSHNFSTPALIPAYHIPEPLEIADLNNDGKQELVAANGGWERVSVYEQNAFNALTNYTLYNVTYASHYDIHGLSLGDISGDGRADIAVADYNNGLVILYSDWDLERSDFGLTPLKAYPNPVTDLLHLDFSNTSENIIYTVCDATGKRLLFAVTDTNPSTIDLSALATGIYYLSGEANGQSFTQKIIKK